MIFSRFLEGLRARICRADLPDPNNGKTKVLFLIHTLTGGGAEKVQVEVANGLDRERFDVTVMTVIDTGINRTRLAADVTYRHMFGFPSFLNRGSKSGGVHTEPSRFKDLLAKIYMTVWRFLPMQLVHAVFIGDSYDVEVAFLEGIPTKVIAASGNRSSKKIAWLHTDVRRNHKIAAYFRNPRAEYACFSAFDRVVCVSEETRQGLLETVGDPHNTAVVLNPIDVDLAVARSQEGELEKPAVFTICTVGRLQPVKGVDRLIRVAQRLEAAGLDVAVSIVGDGPEERKLRELAQSLRQVSFHGYQTNPYPFFRQADLTVIPSYAEGFSTVMVETLAIGTPLISTRVSGTSVLPPELVVDNDEDALFVRLQEIISDPNAYALLRTVSAATAVELSKKCTEAIANIEELLI